MHSSRAQAPLPSIPVRRTQPVRLPPREVVEPSPVCVASWLSLRRFGRYRTLVMFLSPIYRRITGVSREGSPPALAGIWGPESGVRSGATAPSSICRVALDLDVDWRRTGEASPVRSAERAAHAGLQSPGGATRLRPFPPAASDHRPPSHGPPPFQDPHLPSRIAAAASLPRNDKVAVITRSGHAANREERARGLAMIVIARSEPEARDAAIWEGDGGSGGGGSWEGAGVRGRCRNGFLPCGRGALPGVRTGARVPDPRPRTPVPGVGCGSVPSARGAFAIFEGTTSV
jgi:hypothetical protein